MGERKSTPTQRSYGAGLAEGLKLAGVKNLGDAMNNVRLKSMEEGLNGAFRKIYDAIPISGLVGIGDIIRIVKSNGQNIEHGTVKAGLGELLDKGLIRAVSDKYQRIPPKPVVVRDTTESQAAMLAPGNNEQKAERSCNPIERMSLIEAQIKDISDMLQKVAKEVADTAIDAEMFVERIKTDNAKVSQLKELLKSL